MASILVVDDSAVDRVRVEKLLGKEGYSVRAVTGGQEALDVFKQEPPDLVLTDMQMPEMDGLQLVEEIRGKYPAVPVILMTAHGSEEIAVAALQKGAASYVPKRNLAHDLAETIANVLQVARAGRNEQQL